jgi:Papain-like cysteine protease AvrRpt2
MVGEPPANYQLQQYVDWLNTFGPLWITTDSSSAAGAFSPHARILTEITGRGTPDGAGTNFVFVDPATPGSEVTESFLDFIKAFEQMVSDNPSELFIQVVHFADQAAVGEGGTGALSISDQFLTTVINAPANQFKTASDIDAFFNAKTGFDFIVFFANKMGGKGPWTDITIATNEVSLIRFMNIWDNAATALGLTSVNLVQFLSLESAILNETGGRMDIPSETVGIKDFPGLKYTYSQIDKGYVKHFPGKASYNAEPNNRLAFDLFNDADFIAAHGALTGAAALKNTTEAKWKKAVYPLTETSPVKERPGGATICPSLNSS